MEEENTEITDYDYRLYEVSVASQLESVFLQKGYPIEEIKIDTDKNGKIMNITLHFGEGEYCIQNVENYLHELLGEDVKITYE